MRYVVRKVHELRRMANERNVVGEKRPRSEVGTPSDPLDKFRSFSSPFFSLDSRISMNHLRGESGYTHGNVFRAFRFRRGVLDPLAWMSDHCLAGTHIQNTSVMRHPQHSLQYDRELLELRRLPRFNPAGRTAHMGDADLAMAGIDATNVLVDQLGLVARGFDPCWHINPCWHLNPRLSRAVSPALSNPPASSCPRWFPCRWRCRAAGGA